MSEELPTPDAAHQEPARDQAAEETHEVRTTDADAWSTACAEDLAAEKARRRAQYGPPPGSAAEELRRLVDTVAGKLDKLTGLPTPLLGAAASGAAQQVVHQVVQQAKAVVEPVMERNPDVFDHLAAAGSELLAAYRSAVEAQERRWTSRDVPGARASGESRDSRESGDSSDPRDDGQGTGEQRIDLD
ncbi:hypothetical protein OK074_2527 [Actinobacteria bacterium OK074]|nr:hypothetical protein OK074_2527 [Actinobacteria bacterium OK074]